MARDVPHGLAMSFVSLTLNSPAIVFTAPNVAEVLDGPVPVPGPGRILVRTARTCISSGTERDDALAFLRFLSFGRLSLDGFTEEVHAVAEAPAVCSRLAAGGPFPNVQFDWVA